MQQPKVGLLGLYLELYDRAMPQVRPRIEAFYQTIAGELERRGMAVVSAPVCRVRAEFAQALESFQAAGVEGLVSLHLAYSPSLESAPVLAASGLPLLVLDTTPTAGYGPGQDPDELMYNHGIHGVQDLCNLLLRLGKPFALEAGHWQESGVLDRAAAWGRAAGLAAAMRRARVGLIGEPFAGMGDFAVPFPLLKESIGLEVVPASRESLQALLPAPDDPEVDREMAADLGDYAGPVPEEAHRESVRAGLAVRRWLAQEGLGAFSLNFLQIGDSGLPTVPFLEASKAMARGIGYAGEGDVLTAALVGVLAQAWPTTFTEMFCPDWQGNRVFLSHMGEVNLALLEGRPQLVQRPFPWAPVAPPVHAVGRLQPGQAVLVNLAPMPDEAYRLLLAPVRVVAPEGEDRMAGLVHGWLEPRVAVADFLAGYSRVGGTHHCGLAYGAGLPELAHFGSIMGWDTVTL